MPAAAAAAIVVVVVARPMETAPVWEVVMAAHAVRREYRECNG